jgi:hypothetical protein
MDQLCKPPPKYANIGVPPLLHRRVKILAAQRAMTIGQLMEKAVDALELVEQALAHADRAASAKEDLANSFDDHSAESEAA